MTTKQPRPTNAALKHSTTRAVALIDACARVFTALIKYGAAVLIVYFCADAFKSLSGKITLTEIAVKVFGSVAVNQWIAYIFGGGCGVWAVCERRLRRRKIAELAARPIELERIIDPGRSSSMITEEGKTKPGD
jgi:hypothetical protein